MEPIKSAEITEVNPSVLLEDNIKQSTVLSATIIENPEAGVSTTQVENQELRANFMENLKSRTNVLRNHFKSLNRNNLRKSKKVKELQKELALLRAQVQLEQQGFYVFETDSVNGVLKVIRTDFFDEDQEPILTTE